jgi:hypothetical protein
VALYRQFREQGLEVVAVNLAESRDVVEAFTRRMEIPFPVLLDETGRSPVAFGLWAHPNTVLIDRAGRVVGLARGERDWKSDAAQRLIRRLLDERRSDGRLHDGWMGMMGMGGGQMDGRMLQLRGEMLRAMSDVMFKHGKAMSESKS